MKAILFGLLILAVLGLLAALPAITIDKDAVVSSSAWSWIVAAAYFIPTHTIATIGSVIIGLWLFRTVIALVKTICDLLPVA